MENSTSKKAIRRRYFKQGVKKERERIIQDIKKIANDPISKKFLIEYLESKQSSDKEEGK